MKDQGEYSDLYLKRHFLADSVSPIGTNRPSIPRWEGSAMMRLVYVSTATRKMAEDELHAMLLQARARNSDASVTGMLVYSAGNFFQVLEGPDKEVDAIYTSIRSDQRNKGNIVLVNEKIARRNFPDWSMGFKLIGQTELARTPGFSEFLQRNMEIDEIAFRKDHVIQLLYSFKKYNT